MRAPVVFPRRVGAEWGKQCSTFGCVPQEEKYRRRSATIAASIGEVRLPIACKLVAGAAVLIASAPALAAEGPAVLGVPVDFILFAITLLGVALFHRHTQRVALAGLAVITL